jgi:hypothetical protein
LREESEESMARQVLTFVVLPNGDVGQGRLRASIFLTPRLEKGATLAEFPDFLNWTRLLKEHGLTFELTCDGNATSVPIQTTVLRPDIWESIFRPHTRVAPYQIPDFENNLFVSYPTRDAMSFVKYAYQANSLLGLVRTTDRDISELANILRGLAFRDGGRSTLDALLSELRVEMWQEQNSSGDFVSATALLGPTGPTESAGFAATQSLPPDGIPTNLTGTTLTEPPQTPAMASRFALFHHMPPAPGRPPLPSTPAQFAQIMDFHKALTALSSYPTILRALGLVFDLELPEEFCPYSPSVPGGAYLPVAVQAVKPGFKWSTRTRSSFPQTAYYRNGTAFTAAPATPSGNLAAGNFIAGDVVDGVLALSADLFHLTEMDLDGAILKAMTLADNVAYAGPSVEIDQVLPSLRSSGIALMADGRAMQVLEAVRQNKAFDAALQSNSEFPRPFNAMDLVRGYRIDIRSSVTEQWHSLHRRHANYHFGEHQPIVLKTTHEEGFTQLAAGQPADDPTRQPDPVATAAGIPQPGTDVYIHERVAAWTGWSLSVQRPGGALNRSADPAVATDPDPTLDEPTTPFKMVARFEPAPHTLPELRFGARYRLRARAVDLAGNSIAPQDQTASNLALPPNGELPYLRFEPVLHPVVILRDPPKPGGSLERWVIRTYNTDESLDKVRTKETDQRHLAPPKIAVRLAEWHGMFDDALGKLRGDHATFNEIVTRDKGDFKAQGGVPMDSRAQLPMPYFPDPLARGAAFQNLPHTNNDTSGELVEGALKYTTLPDVQLLTGSSTHIAFGHRWPDREPFRVVVEEGSYLPQWDNSTRVFTIYLEKAQMVEIPLSCYMNSADLSLMGVWDWMREFLEACEAAAMQNSSANFIVPSMTDAFALLTRLVLEGGHPMLTPSLSITLVHAVQQPLGRPQFTLLPVTHQAAEPLPPSALLRSFAPITAWRSAQSHHAYLLGGMAISGSSSSKIDIEARWQEFIDELGEPAPLTQAESSPVDTIELTNLVSGPILADLLPARYVAIYISELDVLWFAAPLDTLQGASAPTVVSAPMHRFPDTKHRQVSYTATATSRFSEYFQGPNLKFTRTGDPVLVDVPSSSRPLAPVIAYIIPTFGIERQDSTNVKTEVRFGNGLRVYIHRPWYSSGEQELLGAVLWPASSAAPTTPQRELYKHLITQWGLDPIWQTEEISEMPATSQFTASVANGSNLTLEESTIKVDVAGHNVGFDSGRRLWYCDITFENPFAYTPFVRLALARYQPHSIPGVELSHVILADYAQLSPDRSAVVSVDPSDPSRARVFVGGLAPLGPNRSRFVVAVERRKGDIRSDLAWEPATSDVTVTPDAPAPDQPDAVLWSGTITFTKAPAADRFRIVVTEYEVLPVDPTPEEIFVQFQSLGSRIVYAAVIPYDFPDTGPK